MAWTHRWDLSFTFYLLFLLPVLDLYTSFVYRKTVNSMTFSLMDISRKALRYTDGSSAHMLLVRWSVLLETFLKLLALTLIWNMPTLRKFWFETAEKDMCFLCDIMGQFVILRWLANSLIHKWLYKYNYSSIIALTKKTIFWFYFWASLNTLRIIYLCYCIPKGQFRNSQVIPLISASLSCQF